MELSLHLKDEPATLAAGRQLAQVLVPGLYLALRGELGAGKTTLVRGILGGLGYPGTVRSPTYTLLEPYSFSRIDFYHFDLFRFRDEIEWHDSGFRDCFNAASVCVVEWPERAASLLPPPDLDLELLVSQRGRDLRIVALSDAGRRCLEALQFDDSPPAQAPPR